MLGQEGLILLDSTFQIAGLLQWGARVVAHDPVAMPATRRILGDGIEYRDHNYDVLDGADALLIHTEWHPYRHPDFARMRSLLKEPVIMDGRNLYAPRVVGALGFEYHSVGRGRVTPQVASCAS